MATTNYQKVLPWVQCAVTFLVHHLEGVHGNLKGNINRSAAGKSEAVEVDQRPLRKRVVHLSYVFGHMVNLYHLITIPCTNVRQLAVQEVIISRRTYAVAVGETEFGQRKPESKLEEGLALVILVGSARRSGHVVV